MDSSTAPGMPTPDPQTGKRAYELDRKHVFHSWSVQGALNPLVLAGGLGSYVWDYDGNHYLDLSCQLVYSNLGHANAELIEAIERQARTLCTVAPSYANLARSEAAAAITGLFPESHNKIFFTNGGADANENAIRMARLFTGRDKVLSTYRSYHGNTGAAIVATGDPRRWPNEYARGHGHFFGPFLYRSPFWATTPEQESARALEHLEELIVFEGPSTIAAILLESVAGSAGVMPPPPGYLRGVRDLCDKYGIVYIADEVMVGFGRVGRWFGFQLEPDVVPDLITVAKGVNSGYVPIGGVVISDEIAHYFDDKMFPGGLTYSGHPLAAATATANIEYLKTHGVIEHARTLGETQLGPALVGLGQRHPSVGDVRGAGMFWGIELVRDRATKEPMAPYTGASPAMAEVAAAGRANGLLLLVFGNRIHVAPPLTLSEDEARAAVEGLDQVLAVADSLIG
ncbi:MAG: aspartate aminotransferase family protein [Actinomycetes bacterium]